MSRKDRSVRIEPIQGEPLRYKVESWEDPEHPHTVDLSLHQGNGACSCWSFRGAKTRAIKAGAGLFTRATTCRHLFIARKYWTITTLGDIAAALHPKGPDAGE